MSSAFSQITSATSEPTLCFTLAEFHQWAAMVGLDTNIKPIPETEAHQKLRDLINLSNQFPIQLTIENSPEFQFIPATLKPIADRLRSALLDVKRSNPTHFSDTVKVEPHILYAIISACEHAQSLIDTGSSEATKRILLNNLLIQLCQTRDDLILNYELERELKLPETQVGDFAVTEIIADVMYLHIPDFRTYGADEALRHAASAIHSNSDNLQVVHCVAGLKQTDSSHQCMMGIISGLYQRIVLDAPGHYIFGIFRFNEVFLQIVAGIWQDNKVHLYDLGQYSIIDPVQLLRFSLVARGIQDLGKLYAQELLDSDERLHAQVMNNPPSRTWVPVCMDEPSQHPGVPNAHQGE
ncbi:unnamed protein product [Rhizoctonia solani]|uniref:Uncharacterized protein n=1 Tax=Rhizoctonia solani TaxID=456999 RepID=A0A8H3HZD6_9AGAM|nr:unnamed protein product [Rhizoctonia solani]